MCRKRIGHVSHPDKISSLPEHQTSERKKGQNLNICGLFRACIDRKIKAFVSICNECTRPPPLGVVLACPPAWPAWLLQPGLHGRATLFLIWEWETRSSSEKKKNEERPARWRARSLLCALLLLQKGKNWNGTLGSIEVSPVRPATVVDFSSSKWERSYF